MIRLQTAPGILREAGQHTYQAIQDVVRVLNLFSKQMDWDPEGANAAPPAPSALNVTAANGVANLQVVDSYPTTVNPAHSRTITYTVEAATDAGFLNVVHTEYMGHARNKNIFLGNQTLFFRVISQTFGSPPSLPTAFGGTTPQSVVVGGVAAPTQQKYQGSGTSKVSGQGFGANPGNQARAAFTPGRNR